MIRIKRILKLLLIILSIGIVAYEVHLLWPSIGWNAMRVLEIGAFVFGVFISIVIFVSYLMSQSHRLKKAYVSFPPEMKKDVDKFRDNNLLIPELGTESLKAGEKVDTEVKKKIAKSSYCFVIITEYISPIQKKEIREMKNQRKEITPILIDGTKPPMQLSDYVPIHVESSSLSSLLVGN